MIRSGVDIAHAFVLTRCIERWHAPQRGAVSQGSRTSPKNTRYVVSGTWGNPLVLYLGHDHYMCPCFVAAAQAHESMDSEVSLFNSNPSPICDLHVPCGPKHACTSLSWFLGQAQLAEPLFLEAGPVRGG